MLRSEEARYSYENWYMVYNSCIEEVTNIGWLACQMSYTYANQLFKEATNMSLFK